MAGRARRGLLGSGLEHPGFGGLGADHMSVLSVYNSTVYCISIKIYVKNPAWFSRSLEQQEITQSLGLL